MTSTIRLSYCDWRCGAAALRHDKFALIGDTGGATIKNDLVAGVYLVPVYLIRRLPGCFPVGACGTVAAWRYIESFCQRFTLKSEYSEAGER
ncbi:MAG: hypothetical protein BWY75_03731 [bacterium ADurb.Bin425]|nr:MAG: hypothetical protein BWY75_03731 [bacterium ADurb.Bin425]